MPKLSGSLFFALATPALPSAALHSLRERWPAREYLEVFTVLALLTLVSWFVPLNYRALGHVYLLVVILLSLRVGRGPILFAAIASALAWNYFFMPPRLSFSVLHVEDDLMLGTYATAALIGSQLTTRIREQERVDRQRERRVSALYELTRALTAAHTLDEAAAPAVQQADTLFHARTALLLVSPRRRLVAHASSSLTLDDTDQAVADWAWHHAQDAGRFTAVFPSVSALHVPMRCAEVVRGVLALRLLDDAEPSRTERQLMEAFAGQIAQLIERERLRAASEREKLLQESNRLHRTLLDSVSHELKTPLAVLRTAVEKCDTPDAMKRAALVQEMRTATRRLDHLVANLLNQTRLEGGRLEAQMDWCDLRDIIASARRAIGETLAGHRLTLELPSDLPLVLADAPLLEQVLTNLLLNAALHTPADAPIAIGAEVDHAASRLMIAVRDRGPGIPEELADTLFQKFSRGPAARAGGLGLGLSIVKGFMLAQGGGVTVSANPGGGACFTLHLPLVEPAEVPHDER